MACESQVRRMGLQVSGSDEPRAGSETSSGVGGAYRMELATYHMQYTSIEDYLVPGSGQSRNIYPGTWYTDTTSTKT